MSRYQFIEQFFDHDSCRLLPVAEPDSATDGQTRSLQPTLPFCAMPSRRLRTELQVRRACRRALCPAHLTASPSLRALNTRQQHQRTTVANPARVVAENLLLGQPTPTAPNQVWVGNITYRPPVGGRWCYLATWRATCSRCVVGWHLASRCPSSWC
jgi:transposase InsO family protein